jgi:frataxin-like iron-binding protein CyaY
VILEDFEQASSNLFNTILTNLDDRFEHLDVIDTDESLTITDEQNRTFLIHRHHVLKEVWYSSPYSGAWHFRYLKEINTWQSTRNQNIFFPETLWNELHE